MLELSLTSQVILYGSLAFYLVYAGLILYWQPKIARGEKVLRPDGSYDDIGTQPELWGLALANIFLVFPVIIIGIIFILLNHRMGYYLMALVSFWALHVHLANTATSLKIHKPKMSLSWFFVSPLYGIIGLVYVIWSMLYFDVIYRSQNIMGPSLTSRIILYIMLAIYVIIPVVVLIWQFQVMRGKRIKNPDGEYDDWRKFPMQYGYAVADVFLCSPVAIIGIIMIILNHRFGYYLVALASSVYIWCFGFMFFELKYHKPRINPTWLVTFVLPPLLSLGFVIWTMIHFDMIY